jgi:glutamate--tRNA ligase
MSVRVRFAPSPTGFVHIGSLRTALYNYLYAKKNNGVYLLRVEDTDRTRLVDGAIESMLTSLKWANISSDEGVCISDKNEITQLGEDGPYIQSERLDIYKKYIDILVEKGHAYYCFCSKERLESLREEQKQRGEDTKYDGHCKSLSKEEIQRRIANGEEYVIRLKMPKNVDIAFDDVVRGRVVINSDTVDDQVLMKSDGFPTYHFAVVVDDHLMKVTHIIRGEEWLTSTPKHVMMYEMFGWEKPTFVHLPNILNADKKKLSKRQGDVAVEDFRKKGYLPEGLINYIALLGWSPEENKEIFSLEELVENFSLERVSSSGGVFDVAKLNWVNAHYIKEYPIEKLVELSVPFVEESGLMTKEDIENNSKWLHLAMDTIRDRLSYLKQFPDEIKTFLLDNIENVEDEAIQFMKLEHMKTLYEIVKSEIENTDIINAEFVDNLFTKLKEQKIKGKNLFMGLRVVITGQTHGPDIHKSMELMGKQRLLKRLEQTKQYIF